MAKTLSVSSPQKQVKGWQ